MMIFLNKDACDGVSIARAGVGAELFDHGGRRYLDFWGDVANQPLGAQVPLSQGIAPQLSRSYRDVNRTRTAYRLLEAYEFDRMGYATDGRSALTLAFEAARRQVNKQGIRAFKGNTHIDGTEVVRENRYQDDVSPAATAAIVYAPMAGKEGVKVRDRKWLMELRMWCSQNRVLLIFDETQSGSGITGEYSAARWYGVHPDILVLGGRMALGLPLGAVLVRDWIDVEVPQQETPISPLIASLAECWLDWLEDGGLDIVRKTGRAIQHELSRIDWIDEVDAAGMLISFKPKYRELKMDGSLLCHRARENGLLIAAARPFGDIYFTPPCNVTGEQLADAFEALHAAAAIE